MQKDNKDYFVYVDGLVGNLGTKILIEQKKSELEKHFSNEYLNKVLYEIEGGQFARPDFYESIDVIDSLEIGKGGLLTALWVICDKNKFGLKFDLSKVPILQGTIEVANYFDLTPYRLLTNEAKVIIAKNEIKEIESYSFNLIGKTNGERKRVRIDGEAEAFLTKDYKDEIDKVIKNYTKGI